MFLAMSEHEISFSELPKILLKVLSIVEETNRNVQALKPYENQRSPIGIEKACLITQKKKSTIYKLCNSGQIPCYKKGKRLYFYEDELLNWLKEGKRKTIEEVRAEIKAQIRRNTGFSK